MADDGILGQLADTLVTQGYCDRLAMDRALRVSNEGGHRLDSVLLQLGLLTERGLATALADLLGLALVNVERYPNALPPESDRLSVRFLRDARALPLVIENDTMVVAVVDPLDPFVAQAIAKATGRPVKLEVAVPIEMEAAFGRLYPEDEIEERSGDAAETAPSDDDAERLKDLASEAPVIRLVNQIVARAVESRASDIHIEPFEDRLRIRYRHDGLLHEAESPPARLTSAITSRIKIMAKLDIAERRLPQDGRIKLAVRGQEIDFRVSTIPSLHGENVVLRVLDRGVVDLNYATLGLAPAVVSRLSDTMALPNGIVLVTGPTGSGKTTTLYTGLLALNSIERKIITIEEPIEYQLPGIIQIQAKPQIGLDFATLLRAILRQNPNVIMVGEIRDLATAEVAVQAALTGHMVLSTLHTNSAAASISRLRNMGLEDYLLNAVLRGILAQRLVRRLCEDCKCDEPAAPEVVQRFALDTRPRPPGPIRLWRAVGCPHCRGSGFSGRQAISEFLVPDANVERLIFAHADQNEIERAAVAGGMRTMFDAGMDAALAGTTTIEEVVRSIRAEA